MKWYKLVLYSILSGLLFAYSWYPHGLPFLIFFAWLPLFYISDSLLKWKRKASFVKGWLYSWPAFLVWNAITTYWIGYCTVPGGFGAVFLNSLFQSWVFGLWQCSRKHIKQEWMHPLLLIAFWMSFEFLHLHWDLTWPWLNLGNVFATCPHWVQWYSVTGTFGGTLWILVLNFLFHYMLKKRNEEKQWAWGYVIAFFTLLLVPCIISAVQFKNYEQKIDKSTPIQAVVVQQNTDPWEEEFTLTNREHIRRLIDVSSPHITEKTNLVVCAESSVARNISLSNFIHNDYLAIDTRYNGFMLLDSVISIYPNLNYILGISTHQLYDHAISNTCKQLEENLYVEHYNTACCYNKNRYNGHYHKSRLVPGVEKMPFPKVFGFLGETLIKLGGTNTSLGLDTKQRAFTIDVNGNPVKVSAAICYESIYGELCGKFIRNGANILTVITNDSWWKDSPGHMQHFEMARLRAVETRRYVLRSANGGFSGVISPTGDVLQKTRYDERTALEATVYAQDHQTFYAKHGDYLARIAVGLAAIGILYTLFSGILTWIVGHRKRA